MRIIVTGGRDYKDQKKLEEVLDLLYPSFVIEGGAAGADELARTWCLKNKVEGKTYRADWNKHGRSAGPIRNRQMIEENPDAIVIAFPGGKGTQSCIEIAKSFGRLVLRVEL